MSVDTKISRNPPTRRLDDRGKPQCVGLPLFVTSSARGRWLVVGDNGLVLCEVHAVEEAKLWAQIIALKVSDVMSEIRKDRKS
jgi:hypothetical protein